MNFVTTSAFKITLWIVFYKQTNCVDLFFFSGCIHLFFVLFAISIMYNNIHLALICSCCRRTKETQLINQYLVTDLDSIVDNRKIAII